MWTGGTIFAVCSQTYILIEKDICDRWKVSVKLPCVYVWLSPGDLFIFFGKKFLFLFYFCVILTSILPHDCNFHFYFSIHMRSITNGILDNGKKIVLFVKNLASHFCHSDDQGPDFDDMSSFFPCEIDNAIQYINLGYGAQAPNIVIL